MCGLNKLIAFCGGIGTRKCKEKVVHEHKSFCWGDGGCVVEEGGKGSHSQQTANFIWTQQQRNDNG